MTPPARPARGSATTIGRVAELLTAEFGGVSVSKIRYLESQGLVHPERLAGGRRAFAGEDIDRLRFVLQAQREKFWPLKVIRAHLDRLDHNQHEVGSMPVSQEARSGLEPAPPPQPPSPSLPTARRRRSVRLSPQDLRDSTGLDLPTYSALKSFGLLRLDAAGRHGVDDIEIARQASALAAYGVEARHLRLFRVAADREIGLAEQILEPLRRRRARGMPGPDPQEVQAEIVARGLALHTSLVRAGLHPSG